MSKERLEAAKKRRAALVTERNNKKQQIRVIEADTLKINSAIGLIDLELSNQQSLPL